jgi:uncharacterized protein (TIGR02611 family)
VPAQPARSLHSPIAWIRWIGRNTKRLLVLVIGVAILGAGVAMLALPGPGILVIVVGLAILATEFAWAERALDRTTTQAANAASKVSARKGGRLLLASFGLSLIIGGALAMTVVGEQRVLGASALIAGLVGLATLLPYTQRWIQAKATTDEPAGPTMSQPATTSNGASS